MILVAMTMLIAGVDMSAGAPRKALVACLKDAQVKAKNEKIASSGFEAFARTNCSAQIGGLKDALIAIDSKNGIGRNEAASNANMDIAGYFETAVDRYKMETETQVAATPQ